MSSPPHSHSHRYSPNHIDNSFLELLDNPWPFSQETNLDPDKNVTNGFDSSILIEQEDIALADLSICEESQNLHQNSESANNMVVEQEHNPASMAEAGIISSRSSVKKKRLNDNMSKRLESEKEEGSEVPNAKKKDHNAKERVRRMKLNASYLDLGALLPHFQRSKKRWSAPNIIDRVAEYIPELENEIEKLTLKKDNMLAAIGNKQPLNLDQHEAPTVTVHEITRGEMIMQICMKRRDQHHHFLSSFVHKMEAQGMCSIVDASAISVSDDSFCIYQLHIQMNESSDRAVHYNIEDFKEMAVSWLAET